MGTPNVQLRVTDAANEALKRVVARFPKWSLSQLADSLITEACEAILRETPDVSFPTVDYVRSQIHKRMPAREDRLLNELSKLRYDVDRITSSMLNEEPAKPPRPRSRKTTD